MSRAIPIIRLHGNLLVSVQIALSDRLILELKDELAREIQSYGAHGLVIEVSGVDLVDSFIAACIQSLSKMARLMGARTILAGLNAGMAITLVEMGMRLDGVETALDLGSALDLLGLRARAHARRRGRARTRRASSPRPEPSRDARRCATG
jgi:rsbT antagonist protein RsbS